MKIIPQHLIFKEKINKKAFVFKLVEMFGLERLSSRNHCEMNAEGNINMTLFYVDGIHAGTWCKGQGWIFNHVADKIINRMES